MVEGPVEVLALFGHFLALFGHFLKISVTFSKISESLFGHFLEFLKKGEIS